MFKINLNTIIENIISGLVVLVFATGFAWFASVSLHMKPFWIYTIFVIALLLLPTIIMLYNWKKKNKLLFSLSRHDIDFLLDGKFNQKEAKFIFNNSYHNTGGYVDTSTVQYFDKGKEIFNYKGKLSAIKLKIDNRINPYYTVVLRLPNKTKEYHLFFILSVYNKNYQYTFKIKEGNKDVEYNNAEKSFISKYNKEKEIKFLINFPEGIQIEDLDKETTIKVFIKSFSI